MADGVRNYSQLARDILEIARDILEIAGCQSDIIQASRCPTLSDDEVAYLSMHLARLAARDVHRCLRPVGPASPAAIGAGRASERRPGEPGR